MISATIDKYNGVLFPKTYTENHLNSSTNLNHTKNSEIAMNKENINSQIGFISDNPAEAKVLIGMVLSLISGIILVIIFKSIFFLYFFH